MIRYSYGYLLIIIVCYFQSDSMVDVDIMFYAHLLVGFVLTSGGCVLVCQLLASLLSYRLIVTFLSVIALLSISVGLEDWPPGVFPH